MGIFKIFLKRVMGVLRVLTVDKHKTGRGCPLPMNLFYSVASITVNDSGGKVMVVPLSLTVGDATLTEMT